MNVLCYKGVRHPQERLLATFKDKFELRKDFYYQQIHGKRIHDIFGLKHKKGEKYNVAFQQFVTYILELHDLGVADDNQAPYRYLCQPCLFQYDFIGKLETYTDDMNYLFNKILQYQPLFYGREYGLSEFTNMTDMKTKLTYYYNQIPTNQMERLEKMYKPDLDLFGYKFHYFSNHKNRHPDTVKDFIFEPVIHFQVIQEAVIDSGCNLR